jgi:hypothetical protein
VWDLLQQMDGTFEAALEDALATEHDRPDPTDGHDDQDDDAYYDDPYLGGPRRLRHEERNDVDSPGRSTLR